MTEIAEFFLWLGAIGFGGPQANIALMQQEAQQKRGWLTAEEFTEGLAVCNLLPGLASTQMAIYIGWMRGKLKGRLLAGVCFILPAFLMMLFLSWLYFTFVGYAVAGLSGAMVATIAIFASGFVFISLTQGYPSFNGPP